MDAPPDRAPVSRLVLCGPQRVGKDTVAAYLAERYGARRYALADPIYDVARRVFGMVEKDRDLLIRIGQALRALDPLVFCKHVARRITEDAPAFAVVTDVRMPHEVEFFAAAGYHRLRLTAPPEVRQTRGGFAASAVGDATEQELNVDPVVENRGSLDALYLAVEDVLWHVR